MNLNDFKLIFLKFMIRKYEKMFENNILSILQRIQELKIIDEEYISKIYLSQINLLISSHDK